MFFRGICKVSVRKLRDDMNDFSKVGILRKCSLPSLKSPSDIIYMSRNTTFQLSSSYKTPLAVRLVAAETKKFVPPLLEINSPFPILVLLLYSLYNKS